MFYYLLINNTYTEYYYFGESMVKRIVVLDDTYKNKGQAIKALAASGVSVKKTHGFKNTFEVTGTKANIAKIPGVAETANPDQILKIEEQVNASHLLTLFGKGLGSLPEAYDPISTGKNETIYLIDSGVKYDHEELSDSQVLDLYSVDGDFTDSTGHGTAMASLMVGKNIGTAKEALLYNVKLFDGTGSVTIGDMLDAFTSILTHHSAFDAQAKTKTVCMPWKIDKNEFIDKRIQELNDNNLLCVAAAGNDAANTPPITPAGIEEVLTVGSVDSKYVIAPFSNVGHDIDIWTQGVDINVAGLDGYTTSSGTSISCAITAGIATHYTSRYPYLKSDSIRETMIVEGTIPGKILITTRPGVNISDIRYSITKTDLADEVQLCSYPSGRLMNVQNGTSLTLDIGLTADVTNVSVLDFSPLPPWITFDSVTGEVVVDSTDLPKSMAPGIYIFALRADSAKGTVIEEYSIGLYTDNEDELISASDFYYDSDLNEYDETESLDIVTYTQLKG